MTRSTASRRARNSASVRIGGRRRPASRPSRRRCRLASSRVEPLMPVDSSSLAAVGLRTRGSRTCTTVFGGSSGRGARRRRRPAAATAATAAAAPASPSSSSPSAPSSSALGRRRRPGRLGVGVRRPRAVAPSAPRRPRPRGHGRRDGDGDAASPRRRPRRSSVAVGVRRPLGVGRRRRSASSAVGAPRPARRGRRARRLAVGAGGWKTHARDGRAGVGRRSRPRRLAARPPRRPAPRPVLRLARLRGAGASALGRPTARRRRRSRRRRPPSCAARLARTRRRRPSARPSSAAARLGRGAAVSAAAVLARGRAAGRRPSARRSAGSAGGGAGRSARGATPARAGRRLAAALGRPVAAVVSVGAVRRRWARCRASGLVSRHAPGRRSRGTAAGRCGMVDQSARRARRRKPVVCACASRSAVRSEASTTRSARAVRRPGGSPIAPVRASSGPCASRVTAG